MAAIAYDRDRNWMTWNESVKVAKRSYRTHNQAITTITACPSSPICLVIRLAQPNDCPFHLFGLSVAQSTQQRSKGREVAITGVITAGMTKLFMVGDTNGNGAPNSGLWMGPICRGTVVSAALPAI